MNAALVLPIDRRQSPAALAIARGVRRLFASMGQVTLPELTLPDGRRADLMALGACGLLTIVEIKSSLADLRADAKWPAYRAHCDRLFFAVGPDMPLDAMPPDAGLIVADAYGAEILREASMHPVPGPRRKAVTLRFAHAAAGTLHGLADPESRMAMRS